MNQPPRIRNLNDLHHRKMYLQHKMRIRQKILNIRLRKVEKGLTVPNITREMFRGSNMEFFMPAIAEFLATKVSGKALIGTIAGILTSIGSIKLFSSRKEKKPQKRKEKATDNLNNEEQLFI